MRKLKDEFDVFEGEGTLFGAITKDKFEGIRFVAPVQSIVEAFEILAGGMDDQIESNWKESRTLASLRDRLLPKLLSGTIRVPEAEEVAEEVV